MAHGVTRKISLRMLLAALPFGALAADLDKVAVGQTVDDGVVSLGAYAVRLPPGRPWTLLARQEGFEVDRGGALGRSYRSDAVLARIHDGKVDAILGLSTLPRGMPFSARSADGCKADPKRLLVLEPPATRKPVTECLATTRRYGAEDFGREPGPWRAARNWLDAYASIPIGMYRGHYAKVSASNFLFVTAIVPGIDAQLTATDPYVADFIAWMRATRSGVSKGVSGSGIVELPRQELSYPDWPRSIGQWKPGKAKGPAKTPFPSDMVLTPPSPDTPPDRAKWAGRWSGWACAEAACDIKLAVLEVVGDRARVISMWTNPITKPNTSVREATFAGDELRVNTATAKVSYRMRPDGTLEMARIGPSGFRTWGVLTRVR